MTSLRHDALVGVLGAGTMGAGIAQLAASAGHQVVVYDQHPEALKRAAAQLEKWLGKELEKNRLTQEGAQGIRNRIRFAKEGFSAFANCGLVIEAIIEDLAVKQDAFRQLEEQVAESTILATNTSSLSVTSIAAACKRPDRVLGLHFFNPVPLMALVEIIPGIRTDPSLIAPAKELCSSWRKVPVVAKDTPGFIVNRVARPFYGEALRILEEGLADIPTVDWALRELGGFKMGPFELMDLIGNDINYKVTESVFEAFYYDPRYRPSLTQKRMVEASLLGRKSECGYYDYSAGARAVEPTKDQQLGEQILSRVLAMLINEAVEALHLRVATAMDLELAMMRGVNYPQGLLSWCDQIGADKVLHTLLSLQELYGEDRYRPSVLLKRHAENNKPFI